MWDAYSWSRLQGPVQDMKDWHLGRRYIIVDSIIPPTRVDINAYSRQVLLRPMTFLKGEMLQRIIDNDYSLTALVVRIETDAEAMILGNALSENYMLHTLNFRYSILSGDRARLLLSSIPPNIEKVTLCNCEIDSQGTEHLARLSRKCCIRFLDLRHNDIGDEGARILSAAMKQKSCALKSLILGNCMIGDAGAQYLSQGLRMRGLQELDLRGNQIGDRGAWALSRALTLGIDLERLDLRDNKIGDAGADSLALAIAYYHTCYTLSDLNLSLNRIGDAGAQKLAVALKVNSTLEDLNLAGNSIGDDGAQALAAALEYNRTLCRMNLSQNTASKEIRVSVAKALQDNRTKGSHEIQGSNHGFIGIGGRGRNASRRGTRYSKSRSKERPLGLFESLRYAVSCG